MSRNMILHARYIGDKLWERRDEKAPGKFRLHPAGEDSKIEKDKFLNSAIETTKYLYYGHSIAKLTYQDKIHYAITGLAHATLLEIVENSTLDIFIEDITSGYFLLLAQHLNLRVKSAVTPDQLEEYAWGIIDDAQYQGHQIENLIGLFEDVCLLYFPEDSILYGKHSLDIGRYIIANNDRLRSLVLRQDTVNLFKAILLEDIPDFLQENILHALLATQFKHSFIDLYRCIEYLFAMPYAISLKKEIKYTRKASELATHCRNILNWKRKEKHSLKLLIDIVENIVFTNNDYTKISCLSQIARSDSEFTLKVAERIYKIRNCYVHQVDLSDTISLNDDEHQTLIFILLEIIRHLYAHMQEEL